MAEVVTPVPVCQLGRAKKMLTPPPLVPPKLPSFHTVSLLTALPELRINVVPPTPVTLGSLAGFST